MDAIFALVISIVTCVTALTGKGLSDFYAMVVGMKFQRTEGSGIKDRVRAFMKSHKLIFFMVFCLGLSVITAVAYSGMEGKSSVLSIPKPTTSPSPKTSSSSSPRPPTIEDLYNTHPSVETSHWLAWSLLDVRSSTVVGSANWRQPTYVMSMIKPWIAVDYLNRNPEPDGWTLNRLGLMIVDSNDQVAYDYFGGGPSLDRLVRTCGLKDVIRLDWSWSLTQMSARDAVEYGECIYSGRATSPRWTAWVVNEMRHVRGDGDFGPRRLFQDRTVVATKNGWYHWEGKWYINCLTVTDDWAISILQQWPYSGGDLKYGIDLADPVCQSVANQVLRLNV